MSEAKHTHTHSVCVFMIGLTFVIFNNVIKVEENKPPQFQFESAEMCVQ